MSEAERELFKAAVRVLNQAYDRRGDRPLPVWPARLRIRGVALTDGVWEMTWSFAGPDGRATFEYFGAGDEIGIRWRRIGGHEIFRDP